jgi:phage baseplate assembly protein W
MSNLAFLGIGEKFSFQPDINAGVALVSDLALIEQSIFDILSTPISTRIYLENYGSYLHLLRFQPNDYVLEAMGYHTIKDSLDTWEGRIQVTDVTGIDVTDSQMNFLITFLILGSNQINSFVFPFFRTITT